MYLSMLHPLYDRPGPWASVYLDTSHDTEDAAKTLELRWRSAREALTAAGCDSGTITALAESALSAPTRSGQRGVALFATHGDVVLQQPLGAPPRRPLTEFGPLPHAMPMVAQLGEQVPYVCVVVDHTGGDITAVGSGQLVRKDTVTGSANYPIRKVKPGGWSQSHHQNAAQETWRRNAGNVASAVASWAERCAAEVIVVAGDPRSRPMLVGQLPERWRERVVQTDAGQRAAGADPAILDDVTIQAVAERAAAHEQDILDRYRTQRGRDAAACTGLPAVVAALQRGQVDTVLLIDDPSSTDHLWVGSGPLELSHDQGQLLAMNVTRPQRVRADAALVRALACSDGQLVLVGPEELDMEGGIAALLHYADASTRRR
jgi:hypothetical protein